MQEHPSQGGSELRQLLKRAGQRNMLIGGLVCVVGIVITLGTLAAASSPGGGRYVIAWGAIAWGAIQFFRGLGQMSQAEQLPEREEHPFEGIKPGLPETTPSDDAFSLRKKFPGQGLVSEKTSPARPPRQRKLFWRLLVPLALFIAMIGGIAFVVQYTPNWRGKKNAANRTGQLKELLEFQEKQSIWDPKDASYVKEFEPEKPGHYDYPFRNITGGDVQMGLLQTNCDCSSIEVFLLGEEELLAWEAAKKAGKPSDLQNPIALKVNERKGIDVPANTGGLVRVNWKSRKGVGEYLRLNVRLWAQPKGKMNERSYVELETRSVLVAPVVFDKSELSVGTLAPGATAEAQCNWWSSTRDKIDLKAISDDPLVTWTVIPFSRDECVKLEERMRQNNINTRIKVAGQLKVKVLEEKGKQQLEQGPFNRFAPLFLEEQPLALLPRLVGRVLGEVEVGNEKDKGKINLNNFTAAKGTKQRVILRAEPAMVLTVDSQKPSYLKVQIKANKEGSTAQKASWVLEVEVPAGSHLGPFADDSAVILKTQATPPRYIRIPVVGSAVQG